MSSSGQSSSFIAQCWVARGTCRWQRWGILKTIGSFATAHVLSYGTDTRARFSWKSSRTRRRTSFFHSWIDVVPKTGFVHDLLAAAEQHTTSTGTRLRRGWVRQRSPLRLVEKSYYDLAIAGRRAALVGREIIRYSRWTIMVATGPVVVVGRG